jgi:hypothetical protein
LQSSEEASKSSPALIQFQFQLLADLFVLGSAAEEIPAAPAELFVLGLLAELEDAQVSSPLRPGRACPTLTEDLPRNPSIALPLGSRGWSSRTTVGSPTEELENESRAGWRIRREVGQEGGDVDGSTTMGEAAREVEGEPVAWDPHVSE